MVMIEYSSAGVFNEDFYEQCVIEHLEEKLGYTHLYGPDVPRTSDEYRDVLRWS